MNREYKVVVYSKITELEEYEYFTNKKDSIKYAKNMADENTITSVWLYEFDDEFTEEYSECIWESEEL